MKRIVPTGALALVAALALSAGPAAGGAVTRQAPPRSLAAAAASVQAALAGIPQRGLVLGRRSARVSVYEYADLICAPCARAASILIAPLVAGVVRSGIASLILEPISESPRSQQFALGTYAAGVQHEAWDYAELAYLRTTPRTDGPSDSPTALARALRLRRGRWRSSLTRPLWANDIEQTARVALIGGFASFPVFVVQGPPRRLPDGTRRRSVAILTPPLTLAKLSAAITTAAKTSRPRPPRHAPQLGRRLPAA